MDLLFSLVEKKVTIYFFVISLKNTGKSMDNWISVLMQFWLNFMFYFDWVSLNILVLNVHFSDKNSFEPKIFQLPYMQNITVALLRFTIINNHKVSLPILGTVLWIRSKYSGHSKLVSLLPSLWQWSVESKCRVASSHCTSWLWHTPSS